MTPPNVRPAPPASQPTLLDRVTALHLAGVNENYAGRPAHAIRQLRRADSLLPADLIHAELPWRELAARVRVSLATSEFELSGTSAGSEALRRAEELIMGMEMPHVQVLLHLQRGYIQLHAGDLSDAVVQFDLAVALLAHADDDARFSVLLNRGTAHLYRGDLDLARGDLIEAIRLVAGRDRPAEELMARHNLGYLEYLAGNLALSLETMREAADVEADLPQGVILLDRSRVLIEAGLVREADEILAEAGRLFMARRLWKDVGAVELARAQCALVIDDVLAARRLAGKARDRFRRRGNDAWRRSAELVLLQADLAAGRPGSRLAPPAKRLVLEFRASGLSTQARTAQLIAAEALMRAGRTDEAQAVVQELPADRSDPVSVRLNDFYVRARLAVGGGDRTAARRHVRNGLTELASYQSSFGSIDLQSGSAVHGRRLAELDVEMALDDGRPSALLEAVERGRATSTRLIPVESPADAESARLLAELRRTVEAVREAETSGGPGGPPARRERITEIQRLLRARSWHSGGSRQAIRPAKAADLLAGLDRQSASMACYVQVGDQLHVVSAGAQGVRMKPLGPAADIGESARRVRADLDVIANGGLPAALAIAIHASLRRSLGLLDAALIAPIALTDERLVIVPTGFLATLPWGLLPSLRGRPVVVSPSGSSWLTASTPRASTGAPAVAVFAGPGLARSDEEAAAIGRLWPGSEVRLAGRADQDSLVDAIAHGTVVHVAAHGEHQAENPLFSSIRLADGPVFAYELDQTARTAEHVVLSACELGQATIRPGDEALGLTSVLLHLGTRSVVSGVARVHDDAAAEVMIRYHAALAGGTDSAQALADACAAETERPAPFVCFGATWCL